MENKNITNIVPKGTGTDIVSTGVKPGSNFPAISAEPLYKASAKTLTSPLTSLSSKLTSPLSQPLSTTTQSKPSIIKYILLIIFLIFLILTLVLYIIKPDSTKIYDIYAPVITFFSKKKDTTITNIKLEDNINDKKADKVDNVDKADKVDKAEYNKVDKEYTGKDTDEVIELAPVSNDTDDPIQSQSKTKSGSCYIGTDKGFRNCVSVGEGDKCMSGDIFPTLEMCINPKLRE